MYTYLSTAIHFTEHTLGKQAQLTEKIFNYKNKLIMKCIQHWQ